MENATPKKRSPMIFILGGFVLLAAFFGGRALIHSFHYESTDNAQVEARSVPVISRVAGFIDSVAVDDYDQVKEGELLIKIEDQEYKLAVTQAVADVANASADLANAQAALSNAVASKKVAVANADVQKTRLEKAKIDLGRDESLFKDAAITQKQLDDSRSNYDGANKQYTANLEQVNLATTQVTIAGAQIQKINALIETRRAALDQAQLRLTYCHLEAPATGRIGKRNLEVGQYVQPGQLLFTVVNDEKFWVVANFKETQLEKMKIGQDVNIKLDGYPDLDLRGKVSSFSLATGAKFALLPPDNSTGNFVKVTQRVPVKIELVDTGKLNNVLKAGLSVDAEVKVD
jgi:membrane fusion protein, multidrug efflux system